MFWTKNTFIINVSTYIIFNVDKYKVIEKYGHNFIML